MRLLAAGQLVICEAWASGDRIGALRIAAGFFDRSVDIQIFKRGMDAHNTQTFIASLRPSLKIRARGDRHCQQAEK